jgi:co-chaperonin GroES (HSP10)
VIHFSIHITQKVPMHLKTSAISKEQPMAEQQASLTSVGVFELGDLKFWALGDRVIIVEDEFKTGYECGVCGGSGKAPCGECGGVGTRNRGAVTVRCPHCANGAVTCPECNGKGGLLVAPEISQRRPTTGKVASAGPACKTLKVGQAVMYSNYAGYVVDLARAGKNVTVRILHETEVLCGMDGQLELRNFKGKNEITEYAK